MKLKSIQTRTYNDDGFKGWAVSLCPYNKCNEERQRRGGHTQQQPNSENRSQ